MTHDKGGHGVLAHDAARAASLLRRQQPHDARVHQGPGVTSPMDWEPKAQNTEA